MSSQRPPLLRRVGRALIAFVLTSLSLLLIGEIGLRFAGYGGTPARWYDSDVGWRFLPNQKRQMFSHENEPLAWMDINTGGFRGPAAPKEPAPEGITRIACLGDSFTHGWGVNDGETYPQALSDILGEEGRSTEVFNFGIPGHNLWNAERLYEKVIRTHQPEVCILGIYLNDAQPEAGGPKHTGSLLLRMLGRTALVEAFHLHLRRRFRIFDAGRSPELKAKLKEYGAHWSEIENNAGAEVARPYWNEALESLGALREACERDGAVLVALLFPSHEQWDEILRVSGAERATARVEWSRTQEFLKPKLEALGIPYRDLMDAYLGAESDPFGMVDQGHPSALGYRIAAEQALRLLEEEELL